MVLANMEEGRIVSLVAGAVGLTSLIPGALYLIYLNRTIKLFQE